VVELGGMIAISIGWQPDGDFGGYRQPLDDAAILVVRDTNDHRDSPFQTGFGPHAVSAGEKRRQGDAKSGHFHAARYANEALV